MIEDEVQQQPHEAPTGPAVDTRRLVITVGAAVFFDTLFYAVVAPLLPGLSHQLHLSKLSAGLLTASYPIGTLVMSLPGGVLAVKAGSRVTMCIGLIGLICSTVAFALLRTVVGLDIARLVEGAGGACSWAGGVAWVIADTPVDRRGALIGQVLAAGIGGAIFGPAIGAIATATGRGPVFIALAVIAAVLMVLTLRLPYRGSRSDQGVGAVFRVARERGVGLAMWLMALPAIISGTIGVLGPLRLHRFGAAAGIIGLTFFIAAAIETGLAPGIGALSDRRGRLFPLRLGLVAAAVMLALFTLPRAGWLLAVVIVLVVMGVGVFWAPAMAMLSDIAETHGLDQGLAAALMNLAWAGGQVIGGAGGGALAKAAGDIVPTGAVALLCVGTLVLLRTVRPQVRTTG